MSEKTVVGSIKSRLQQHFTIVSFVLFQTSWLLAVLGNDPATPLVALALVFHFALSPAPKRDFVCLVALGGIGLFLDFLLTLSGVFIFDPNYLPLWLAFLWMAFSVTFSHSFYWLLRLPVALRALIAGIGGSTSYIGGHFLGAVDFGLPLPAASALLFLTWCLIGVLFCFLVDHDGPIDSIVNNYFRPTP